MHTLICFGLLPIAIRAKRGVIAAFIDKLESTPRVSISPRYETGCNPAFFDPTQDLAFRQKPVFFGFDRMGFNLDHKLARQGEDPMQATWRLERRQREKEVSEAMSPCQHAVYPSAIETVK
jgi:hypothetical protein